MLFNQFIMRHDYSSCYNASMSEQIDSYLNSHTPELQLIIRPLREMAKKSIPEAYEMIYHAAIGYSLSTSPFDRICYIEPQKNYVNLGFFYFATSDGRIERFARSAAASPRMRSTARGLAGPLESLARSCEASLKRIAA